MISLKTMFHVCLLGMVSLHVAVANQSATTRDASSADALMQDAHYNAPKRLAPKFTQALFKHRGDPVEGASQANIAIVEFFDYQCSHCVALAPRLTEVLRTNKNVKIIYKVFSLGSRFSTRAAYAALAANEQGKFSAFHHALMSVSEPLNEDVIMDAAKSVGLDIARLKKDMAGDRVEALFKENMALAKSLQIPGTPVVFVANTRTDASMEDIAYAFGEIPAEQLQMLVKEKSK